MWGRMIIKSLSGKTIIETQDKTLKRTLEYCALKGVDLSGADLRKARLSLANLDGLKAQSASFWGADFTGTDMGFADLQGCDLRCTELKDTCLAHTDLSGADLRGAYFSGTIIEECILNRAIISCPSFWSCDVQNAASLKGLSFIHLGERVIRIEQAPVLIKGFTHDIVLHKEWCMWGKDLYPNDFLPREMQNALLKLKADIERVVSRNAKPPIPKRAS